MSIITATTLNMAGPAFQVQLPDTAGTTTPGTATAKITKAGMTKITGTLGAASTGLGSVGSDITHYTSTTTPSDYGFAGTKQAEAKAEAAGFDAGGYIQQAQAKLVGSVTLMFNTVETARADMMAAMLK